MGKSEEQYYPGHKYQGLFNLMSEQHGLTLLEDEMQEIINEVRKIDSHSPTEPFCERCKSGLINYPEIPRRTCRCGSIGYDIPFDTLQEGDYSPNLSKEDFEKILDIEGESDDVRFEWEEGLGLAYHINVLVDTDYQPNHQTTKLTASEFIRRAENTFKTK